MLRRQFRRAGSAESTLLFSLSTLVPALLALGLAGPAAAESEPDEPEAQPAAPQAPAGSTASPVHAVGDVTVTATRAERDVLEVPSHVSVIGREEIERSGARTLPDLLRRQSGIFVTSTTTNPAGTLVEARGFNNGGALGSSLLVQVDGRRVNQADTGNTDWATLPLDAIESIEIVRGPASALYGDNAVGGVINIRTRPGPGPLRATLNGRVGRYQTGEGSLNAAGSVGPITGSLFVEGLSTDAYRKGADFDREDVKGSLQSELGGWGVLGVSGGWYQDQREFPGALDAMQIATLGRRARQPDVDGNGSDVESRFVEGWLEAAPLEGLELSLRPYYRWRDDDGLISSRFVCFLDGVEVSSDFSTDTSEDSVGVTGQAQLDLPVFERRNRLIAGFDVLHEEVDRTVVSSDSCFGTSTTLSNLERNVYAGFLQDELDLLPNLILSAGVRFDHAQLDLAASNPDIGAEKDEPGFNVWSPKVGLTWRVLPTASLYASYSRGFRLPNLDEDVPVLIFPGVPSIFPELHAQTSNAFELGAKWRGERLDASLALYSMEVKNEIIFDPSTFQNVNFDRVRHRGVEAGIHYWVLDWLAAYASYSFDDVEIREAEDPALKGHTMPITPKNRGTAGLFARFPYRLELTLNANVVGGRKVANDFLGEVDSLDPYGSFDILAAWRPQLGEHVAGALTLELHNVTGEEFEDFAAKSAFSDRVVFNPATKFTWEVGLQLTVRR